MEERYGSRAHEDWLLELEAHDVPDERPDQPYTPCGCTSRAYGGDCAHTVAHEEEWTAADTAELEAVLAGGLVFDPRPVRTEVIGRTTVYHLEDDEDELPW